MPFMDGPRQEDDDGGDGDLQGRKVIKSFFLFLFLLLSASVRRSFVRSLVKVSHFYKDEREEMKRQRRPPSSHSNLPLPTPPKMQIRVRKGVSRREAIQWTKCLSKCREEPADLTLNPRQTLFLSCCLSTGTL